METLSELGERGLIARIRGALGVRERLFAQGVPIGWLYVTIGNGNALCPNV